MLTTIRHMDCRYLLHSIGCLFILSIVSFIINKLFFKFYFIVKLYIIVLVLPNIKMNLPQVYMCSPSWTLLPPPTPLHPSGSSQCTSPNHPVSCIEPGLATRFSSFCFLGGCKPRETGDIWTREEEVSWI